MKIRVRRGAVGRSHGRGKWHGGQAGRVRAEGAPREFESLGEREEREKSGLERRGCIWLHTQHLVWLGHPVASVWPGVGISGLALGIKTSLEICELCAQE